MRFDRLAEPRKVITSFQKRQHLAAAGIRRKIQKDSCKVGKILVCKPKLPQRIARARIKTRRDQEQLRTVAPQGRNKPPLVGVKNFLAAGARRKRAIDRQARARALPRLTR